MFWPCDSIPEKEYCEPVHLEPSPKIKFYFEARIQMNEDMSMQQVEAKANRRIEVLKSDLIDERFPILLAVSKWTMANSTSEIECILRPNN